VPAVRHSSPSVNAPPSALQTQSFNYPRTNPRSPAGGFVKVRAYAKINLFLDVLGKRSDGYHDIISVMQTLDLHDELRIEPVASGVELTCNDKTLPTDESNLVVRAANALINECNISHGFKVHLHKRIPMGAGLAGGSADCAATLTGINKLCGLNLSQQTLLKIGSTLGADVPFCLTGGTALTEGIGEKITPLAPLPDCFIVVACPGIHVSTAQIFQKVRPAVRPAHSDNRGHVCKTTHSLEAGDHLHRINDMLAAIQEKNLPQICSSIYNVFTPITSSIHPEIPALIAKLKNLGAIAAQMTGTGSAVFAIFENSAAQASNIMKNENSVFLTKPWATPGAK